MIDVKVTYFKQSGKYYTDTVIEVPPGAFHELIEFMRNKLARGEFTALIQIPNHVPQLVNNVSIRY